MCKDCIQPRQWREKSHTRTYANIWKKKITKWFYYDVCETESDAQYLGRLILVCHRVSYGLSHVVSQVYNSSNPTKFPTEKFSYYPLPACMPILHISSCFSRISFQARREREREKRRFIKACEERILKKIWMLKLK